MTDTFASHEDATMLVIPDAGKAGAGGAVHNLFLVDESGTRHLLAAFESAVTVGRTPPSDVLIDSSSVSRKHCRFELSGEHVTVTDLNSTNGTFLNGARLSATMPLHHGAELRLGRVPLVYERRTRREVNEAAWRDRDVQGASAYIQMLLPMQIVQGPVLAHWIYLPCRSLSGNAFGYRYLDEHLFGGYMLDVAGQGTKAAMHAVAVMNLLRQQVVPGIDFRDPSSVLAGVNGLFRQEDHNGLFLLMFYFVMDLRERKLFYSSAGRHPAYLVSPGRERATELPAQGPAVGLSQKQQFLTSCLDAPAGTRLYLLSDGASETFARSSAYAEPDDLERLICGEVLSATPEPVRIYSSLRDSMPSEITDEDLSVVTAQFLG